MSHHYGGLRGGFMAGVLCTGAEALQTIFHLGLHYGVGGIGVLAGAHAV